jgi:hypothetical protein
LFLIRIVLLACALFFGWSWANNVGGVLSGILAALATGSLIVTSIGRFTHASAPSRRLSDPFVELILRMKQQAAFSPVAASSAEDIERVGKLEHDAFRGPSRTSLPERIERIANWLKELDGLGQFMYFKGELVGYSVIIPVSENQAEKFTRGYATEWAFDVSLPPKNLPRLTLYSQAVFVRHRHHGDDSSLGIAQAGVLNHLLDLAKRLRSDMVNDVSSETVWRLLLRTRILADEGSPSGARFMRNLGFVRRRKKTSNKRHIWELDLSLPAAEGTSLYQSRRIIAKALHVPDDQPRKKPTLRDSWERVTNR